MFRARGLSKGNYVAVDTKSEETVKDTLKPYPGSGKPEKEFKETIIKEKVDTCSIL